jgi:hypothetical protein
MISVDTRIVPRLRRAARPIRRLLDWLTIRGRELLYRFGSPACGSERWLINRETRYGGFTTNVPRLRLSPLDNRDTTKLAFWGMTGGDRMLHQGYAQTYTRYLQKFLNRRNVCLAEFGILKGSGLAVWCDLFPDGKILGFDIDLSHYLSNRQYLIKRGAFRAAIPEVYEFDQLATDVSILEAALRNRTLDIVIDDGLHSLISILNTWEAARPYLSSDFIYIIEDYPFLLQQSGDSFSKFSVSSFGGITVIEPATVLNK